MEDARNWTSSSHFAENFLAAQRHCAGFPRKKSPLKGIQGESGNTPSDYTMLLAETAESYKCASQLVHLALLKRCFLRGIVNCIREAQLAQLVG